MKLVLAMIFAAVFGLKPIAHEEAAMLEPSIQNEVDHAVSSGERWLKANASLPGDIYEAADNGTNKISSLAKKIFDSTNSLTRTRIAINLISSQRADGWWICPTNAAPTRAAIQILKGL
jgi:hypothetical protein